MAESSTREQSGVQWRRLTPVVWVGRRDGRHIGMIEQGRRYVATDGDGVVRGRFRDLASAERLFETMAETRTEAAPRASSVWPVWTLVTGGALVAVVGTVVSAVLLLQ